MSGEFFGLFNCFRLFFLTTLFMANIETDKEALINEIKKISLKSDFFAKKFAKRQNVYYICTRKREVTHLNTHCLDFFS